MRIVNIDFTKSRKRLPILSWLIRWIEGTEYSHVRIRWTSSAGVELIYEASGNSVKLIGEYARDKFPVDIVATYEIPVEDTEYRSLIKLFRFASVDYGVCQLLGILAARLCGLKSNPFARGRGAQVCSELVALFMKEVKGWDVPYDLDIAGPRDIEIALQNKLTES